MKVKHILFLILVIALKSNTANSQESKITSTELGNWIDAQFTKAIDSLNMAGATMVLMHKDSVIHINGYGLADIEKNIPVNDSTTLVKLASISKTFVGVSIMKLYEEGKLSLDVDINQYLKSLKVDYKYENPITIRQLLTHTAGLDERNMANRVRTVKEMMPLAEYLEKRLPPQIRPPGEALTYSSHGYALLGLIVEDISGIPFHEFVKLNILEPLDMNYSNFNEQEAFEHYYSLSYLQKDDSLIPYEPSFMHQYPAGSMTSTTIEMSQYISMLLNNGRYKDAIILDSLTVSKMFSPAFKHYEKAENGWLYGFYERHWKDLQVIEHGGDIDGFANTLMLIPEKKLGLFISINSSNLKNRKSKQFIEDFTNLLFSKMLPSYAQKELRTRAPDSGFVNKPINSFQGVYRYTRYAQTTLDKVAVFIGLAPEIRIVEKNDTLIIKGKNEQLIPDTDLTFYGTTEKKHYAFGENYKGDIGYFFSDTRSYHKLEWYETVKFQLFIIGGIVLIFLLSILGNLVRILILRKKVELVGKLNLIMAILALIFLTSFGLILLKTDPYEFTYGIPNLLKAVLILPFIFIALALMSTYHFIRALTLRKIEFWKFNYAVSITAIIFIVWLHYWNLIGFNY